MHSLYILYGTAYSKSTNHFDEIATIVLINIIDTKLPKNLNEMADGKAGNNIELKPTNHIKDFTTKGSRNQLELK